MILDTMRAIQAEGVSMCEAHPDLEVFRVRLGKALNYKYNEDTQTGEPSTIGHACWPPNRRRKHASVPPIRACERL